MAEKKETTKIEREYTIPLREKCRPVPRYKKTPKAVKTIKEFLVRHMKIRDKDHNKIKLDIYLNEQIWIRGIKKPMPKIKVKVVKEGDIVRVYSAELPAKINFKKIRHEKIKVQAEEAIENKKSVMQKAKETMQPGQKKEKTKEDSTKDTDKNKDGIADKGVPSNKEAEGKDKVEKEKMPQHSAIRGTSSDEEKAVEETKQKESKEEAKAIKKTTPVKTGKEKAKAEETAKK